MKNAVDCLGNYPQVFKKKRLGLITSVSSVNKDMVSTIDILHSQYRLSALFGPEHGVRGAMAEGALVDTYKDADTGLVVHSLYRKDSKRFLPEMFENIDAVVYDIQDVGVRFYTFISTLLYTLEDCAKYGKELIVLDRINPLGGTCTHGGILDMQYSSFVGCYPLPIRYGLTCGEFAQMANRQRSINCKLTIVPVENYKRDALHCDTDYLWGTPSLNLPRFETALLYSGTCLFEGTNLSEGRGTACPFEIVGAPWINAAKLSAQMNSKKLDGVIFTPVYFTPTTSKHKDVPCQGVHIHIKHLRAINPINIGVELLCTVRDNYAEFGFLPPVKEGSRPFISLLTGSNIFADKNISANTVLSTWDVQAKEFAKIKKQYHLYD